jgi:dTDP-4-dehydrorhamnose reductase
MKKILIFGANGQLGQELTLEFNKNYLVTPLTKSQCDITNKNQVSEIISKTKPDIVINSSAYTNVDDAEDNFEIANTINNRSLVNIIDACNVNNSILIHFSTDYVFNSSNQIPIEEDQIKNPINKYGLSKHLGEEKIINRSKKFYIFRVGWVYGMYGDNFPLKIISLAKKNQSLEVINDQIGTPTSTNFIAETLGNIFISKKFEKSFGIYNLSPNGSTSWYYFANKIFNILKVNSKLTISLQNILPVSSDNFKTKAKRPKYSCLSNTKLIKTFKIKPYNWEVYFDKFIEELF